MTAQCHKYHALGNDYIVLKFGGIPFSAYS